MPCWPSRCCTSGADYRDPQFQVLKSIYQAKVTLRIMLHYWIYEIIPSYNDYPDIASSSPRNHAGARYFSESSGVSVAEGTDQLTRRGRSRDQVRLGKPRQPIAPPNSSAVRPQPCARLELTSGDQKTTPGSWGSWEVVWVLIHHPSCSSIARAPGPQLPKYGPVISGIWLGAVLRTCWTR